MGIYYSLYVGPYFECHTHMTEGQKSVKTCPSDTCKAHGHNVYQKFCSECGTESTVCQFPDKVRAVDPDHIQGIDDDVLNWQRHMDFGGLIHNWTPNVVELFGRTVSFDVHSESNQAISVKDGQVFGEKETMCTYYGNELAILQKHYDEVKIQWGVLMLAS